MNSCNFSGRLTRDPELRYTPSGSAVCDFDIADNKSYKNKAGEKVETVTYVRFVCWEACAEHVAKYFTKGKWIEVVNSEMYTDSWDDKVTGEKRTTTKYRLREFPNFVGPKVDGESDEVPVPSKPKSSSPKTAKAAPASKKFVSEDEDNDPDSSIPF